MGGCEPGREAWALNRGERGPYWDFGKTTGEGEQHRGPRSRPSGEGVCLKPVAGGLRQDSEQGGRLRTEQAGPTWNPHPPRKNNSPLPCCAFRAWNKPNSSPTQWETWGGFSCPYPDPTPTGSLQLLDTEILGGERPQRSPGTHR